MRVSVYLIILMVILLILVISPSYGQTTVTNGRIAFSSDMDGDFEIYTINPDGTDLQQLTFNEIYDGRPKWSPNGRQLLFISNPDGILGIYMMNADGSERNNLHTGDENSYYAQWSPDATRITFSAQSSSFGTDIFIMNIDDSTIINLTNGFALTNFYPFWSSDGDKLFFLSDGTLEAHSALDPVAGTLYQVDPDGSNLEELFRIGISVSSIDLAPDGHQLVYGTYILAPTIITNNLDGTDEIFLTDGINEGGGYPVWSPDGTKIAYIGDFGLSIMNRNGSVSQTILERDTTHYVAYQDPDWQPIFLDTMTATATADSIP